ncbi:polysaccharide biosynthesis protein [Candidatus Rhodobacter oscarellae]|nr:nucleoside-diphosphate sugar epimerase/dehydratase [Candidatus Rhodobacter lobularis]
MIEYIKNLTFAQKQAVLVLVDILLLPIALFSAILVQFGWSALAEHVWRVAPMLALVAVVAAALSILLRIPNTRLVAYDYGGVQKTGVFAALVALTAGVLGGFQGLDLGWGTYVVFGLVFFLASVFARFAMLQFLLLVYQRDTSRCRVLIYGAGTTGLQLAHALRAHDVIVPVAFADDNAVLQGQRIAGLPVLKPSRVPSFAAERGVDRVLLAMPSLSLPKQTQIARRLEETGLEVQALPSFAQLIGEEALVEKFAPVLPGQLLGRAQVGDSWPAEDSEYSGRTILVSGAGGSIGSELCRQVLAGKPAKLVLYELSELALYTINAELGGLARDAGTEIVPILGSVTDARLARKVLNEHEVDIVLHAAAYKHVPLVEANALSGLANNVLGTSTLARASLEAGVKRFILVSSDKAVRPTNVMGPSKRLAELVVQDLAARSDGTIFAMVRFGNVLGSSGSVIPLFQEQIARGGPVTLTHPDVKRYFMTVQEAVRLVLRASSFAKGGEVFVLDMGQPVQIAKLARQMVEGAGYSVRDRENPDGDIEVVITGLRPGEKLNEELLIGEGHLTTAHEKIFAAREVKLSEIEVASALRTLREAVATADEKAALSVVGRWVEGWSGEGDVVAPDTQHPA